MIRILITAEAYAAILAGRDPHDVQSLTEAPGGGFYFWVAKGLLERLTAARGAGESYSDAIVRLASQ
jgi:hypothetical protein